MPYLPVEGDGQGEVKINKEEIKIEGIQEKFTLQEEIKIQVQEEVQEVPVEEEEQVAGQEEEAKVEISQKEE